MSMDSGTEKNHGDVDLARQKNDSDASSAHAKLLTVAVPAYNAGGSLDECLKSFITDPIEDALEVIVVNDGSTDNTREIAQKYIAKYPAIFRLIDKENGGHGSGINAAIRLAAGKYFKVVDADDWILTENLPAFMDTLAETEADAIITHSRTVNEKNGKLHEFRTRDVALNVTYSMDEFAAHSGEIYSCFHLHGLTFRADLYRGAGITLSEGIYFEDREYATLPFTAVRTILPLDLFLYQYRIGNDSQSTSDKNIVKRLAQLEQVTKKLFVCYNEYTNISEGAKRYIAWKAMETLQYYYLAALIKNPGKAEGRREAARVRGAMRAIAPALVDEMEFRYRLYAFMNRLGMSGRMVSFIKRTLLYDIYWSVFRKNRGKQIERTKRGQA